FVKEFISWGAGPRASQYLVLGAKARAALDGRPMPDYDDLKAVAPTVLTHRLVINYAAEAGGRTAPDIVDELLKDHGGRWMGWACGARTWRRWWRGTERYRTQRGSTG